MFSLYFVIDFITVLSMMALMVMALSRGGYSKHLNRLYAFMAMLVAIWLPANHIGNSLEVPKDVAILANYLVFGCSFLTALVLLKIVVYVANIDPEKTLMRWIEPPLWIIGIISFTPLVGKDVIQQGDILGVVFGPVIGVYGLALTVMVGAILTTALRGCKIQKGYRRDQLRSMSLAIVSVVPLVLLLAFILPVATGDFTFTQFGTTPIVFFAIVLYYAVIHQRLFDIRTATVRTVGYVLSLLAMAGLYIILAYSFSLIFFQREGGNIGIHPASIAVSLILALVFQPIKRFFDKLTDTVFYYNQCRPEVFSREISAILTQTTELQLLTRRVNHYIAKTLKAERVTFCIPERGIYGRAGRRRRFVIEEDVRKIMEYYTKHHIFPEAIISSEVRDSEMRRLLDMHKTKIVMPLIHQDQEVGILFLGEHKRLKYSMRDIRMLELIASELAVAVQNALSMEEVRELNVSLQRRIDEATKELRFNNRQLQRLDEAKNEFISMASHQLRTPLTSIKGYLDMVLQGDLGRVAPTQKTVLREAFASSERMVRLINDFLNVSRLQTGKFMIDKQRGDMVKIVKEEIALVDVMAEQRSIAIKLTVKGKIPEVAMDIEKMRQVILNMIDNAIFYSRPGSKVTVNLSVGGELLEFTVKDSGIGIPKSEQAGIFGKFFRASNARKKRPDGTGIGLFLAKKVILLHDGEMIFASEEGKGSTFGFRIPIRQL